MKLKRDHVSSIPPLKWLAFGHTEGRTHNNGQPLPPSSLSHAHNTLTHREEVSRERWQISYSQGARIDRLEVQARVCEAEKESRVRTSSQRRICIC